MIELQCKWCPQKKLNPKPAKPAYKMAKGLIDEWKPICKRCYELKKWNPLFEFKELEKST